MIVAERDTAELDTADSVDMEGCADIAESAGNVGFAGIVEVVDIAGLAADSADIVAATEGQPCLATMTPLFPFYCRYRRKEYSSDHGEVGRMKILGSDSGIVVKKLLCFC